ncbi:MAG TPA: TrpB-like pyridoxal phosphate-dependent enzyme [Solirubrobacterales bacterium]|jgi:tryptophan synthase beta chain|nr:TrpB-like pyridoxal phosphate-dependent enzyme [Solirubrobacterales bacterium]
MAEVTKFLLGEDEIPTTWVNLLADLPGDPPPPPLNPQTGEPAGPDDLSPIFAMALIGQEVSSEPEIEIPEEVRDIYRLWRPTPLLRARRLERELDTPAHIYYKYEGVSPAGSHKPNSAVPQAYFNKQEGVRKLVTETGAGQWGSALALACRMFEMECEVFMVGVSYDQKPYRRAMMETWGATVHRSPSDLTVAGRSQAEHDSGSLGIAISEAVEVAAGADDANYTLGSVLNHVCLHQTVVGQEAIRQMEMAGEAPDVVVGCVGGGSNFAGISYPLLRQKLRTGSGPRFVAAEPAACPTLTRGRYAYDYGDTVGMTPLMPMYTLGHDFVPPSVHAGGLRYHGDAPSISALVKEGAVEAVAIRQTAAFEAAVRFARCEGIIPAPEPAHALRAAFDEAEAAKRVGEERVILINLCGHGHFDMSAYDAYLRGELEDLDMPEQELEDSLTTLPEAPALT